VRRGAEWCTQHADEAGVAVAEPLDERAAEFQRRLANGDYRELFGQVLREIIDQAGSEQGLADEIGILRVVLAKLLVEESDPAQLATNVARVATVAIQAARAQRAISGEQAAGLTDAITRILVEMDGNEGARG
jgi:hypothetical protein